MKMLGLIPARAGSQRLPHKNVADLNGVPLINWTLAAAVKSREFEKVVVSTDDEAIIAYAAQWPVEALRRPADLARADTPTLLVVRHALWRNPWADAIAILQPTSPLRTYQHVIAAAKQWRELATAVYPIPSLVSVRPDGTENGAIFIVAAQRIRDGEDIYDEKLRDFAPFAMSEVVSVDIDTEEDLELARKNMRADRYG